MTDALRVVQPDAPALDFSARRAYRVGRPSTSQRGTAGTYVPDGLISGVEDNTKLRWDLARGTPTAPGVWEKMEREDPQIAAMVRAVKSVILAAPWSVEPPEEADDEDVEIAAFVEQALVDLDGGFRRFLREALTFLTRGFSLFEEVYRKGDDGLLSWAKLGHRLQRTVRRWRIDAGTDELAEVEFYAPFGGQDFREYRLPASVLTHFALDQEGNNYEGTSLLRPAFTFWLSKRATVRGTSIDVGRSGAGYMDFSVTDPSVPITQDDIDRCHEIALNWRINEFSHGIRPAGMGMQFVYPEIPFEGRVSWLHYLDQQIAKVFLATFFELGLDRAGTQALGGTLTEHFILSLRAVAAYIEDALNATGGMTVSGPIRRLIEFNWGPRERWPRFKFGNLNPDASREALGLIIQGQPVGLFGELGVDDVNRLRSLVDLAPMTEDQADEVDDEEPEPEPEPEPEGGDEEAPEAPDVDEDKEAPDEPATMRQRYAARIRKGTEVEVFDAVGARLVAHRPLTAAEGCVAFSEVAKGYEATSAAMEAATRPILDRAARRMSRDVRAILNAGLTQAAQLDKIQSVGLDMDELEALRKAIQGVLSNAATSAEAEAGREVRRQSRGRVAVPVGVSGTRAPVAIDAIETPATSVIIRSGGLLSADKMATDLEMAVRTAGSSAVLTASAAPLRDIDEAIASKAPGWFSKHTTQAVSSTVTSAREDGALQALEQLGLERVEYVLYTSVLDGNTCGPCAAADGREFPLFSEEYQRLRPPLAECEGRGNCRCLYVYIGSSDSEGT